MKRTGLFILLFCVCSQTAYAHLVEDLWEKYAPESSESVAPPSVTPAPAGPVQDSGLKPGRDFSAAASGGDSPAFLEPWKYREKTYELHYAEPEKLAQSIYSLALHAGDISADLPREKFLGGVLGFHYSVSQICAWLNDVFAWSKDLSAEENAFIGLLLQDGVVRVTNGSWHEGPQINHVLGAAPGKRKAFDETLHHERLHVYWDEDEAFRTRETQAWENLSEAERETQRDRLKNYNQNNEQQLIEEWAVIRAENSNMPLE